MLVLVESAAGLAVASLPAVDVENPAAALQSAKVVSSARFESAKQAVSEITAINGGTVTEALRAVIAKATKGNDESIWVVDKALAAPLGARVLAPDAARALRAYDPFQLPPAEARALRVGLGHSLAHFALKFSPAQVDLMVVQAAGLLEELDGDLNGFLMKLREWFGYHFPELAALLPDGERYARAVAEMGTRAHAADAELGAERAAVLAQAQLSMGSDLAPDDVVQVKQLANACLDLCAHRRRLQSYLETRVRALAPNLALLVGDSLAAKLIAKAGTLGGLAKMPASTIQILGAEKAFFRALKTKANTPKYGLIYHAAYVTQTAPQFKGRTSRTLAAKIALAARCDAYQALAGTTAKPTVATQADAYLKKRIASYKDNPKRPAKRPLGGKPPFRGGKRPRY